MEEIYELLKNHPRSDHRWIGLEVERFLWSATKGSAAYEPTVRQILEELAGQKAWKVDYAPEGKFLALSQKLHAISLEPGAQFETSLAPRTSIFDIEKDQSRIDDEVLGLSATKNLKFLELGLNPIQTVNDFQLLPSPRYALMDTHYKLIAPRGRDMMRLSAGLQVNIDYSSPREATEMLQAAFLVCPFLSALFSNSPYRLGKHHGILSERHLVWTEHDLKRSGILDFVFEPDFSLEKYCTMISKVPLMYAYDLEGKVIDPKGASFSELPKEIRKANALAALREIFTEARLKPCCVEIRFFDAQNSVHRWAAAAMIVGLLYDEENRFIVRKRLGSSRDHLKELMLSGAKHGIKAEPFKSLLPKILQWAEAGLVRRGYGEEKYLEVAEELILNEETPAEIILRRFGQTVTAKDFE